MTSLATAPTEPARSSFDDFVRSRRGALVRLAVLITRNRDEAEDAVQEALTALLPKWAGLPAGAELQPYVNRAVVNACLKRHRAKSRSLPTDDLEWVPGPAEADPGASVVLARQAWALCAELSGQQRAAVVLRFYQDLDYAEIAAVLGCREATARSHVHRAVAALRVRHQKETDND